MYRTDICIAGAGIIGLSLALELHARGVRVAVVEAGDSMQQASTAAAGMLAADDPDNPAALSALAHLSLSLYPSYLDNLALLGGLRAPFQTTYTLQSYGSHAVVPISDAALNREAVAEGFRLIPENSLDPRQLASAILAAIAASDIRLFNRSPVVSTRGADHHVAISTALEEIEAAHFVDCTGAWAADPLFQVTPIKGQMLTVTLPRAFPLKVTVRTSDIYIVPRTTGTNAGRAVIGATIEDVGFDKTIHASLIEGLHRRAVALIPQLADEAILESWAGLRPATADRLPLLGPHPTKPRHWVAVGHYRNGILLAPATASVMTQLLLDETPSVSLGAFSPTRSQQAEQQSHTYTDIRPQPNKI